jgi:PHD/YefM family antitoxin component YafN of YafNO toxin-antitoxin module
MSKWEDAGVPPSFAPLDASEYRMALQEATKLVQEYKAKAARSRETLQWIVEHPTEYEGMADAETMLANILQEARNALKAGA